MARVLRHPLVPTAAGQQLLATLEDPKGPIAHALFGADGRQVGTATADGRLQLWDTATGKSVPEFPGDPGRRLLAADSDGHWLVYGRVALADGSFSDRGVEVWEAATGKRLPLGGLSELPRHAALSKDNRRIVTTDPEGDLRHGQGRVGRVEVWDAQTGKL